MTRPSRKASEGHASKLFYEQLYMLLYVPEL